MTQRGSQRKDDKKHTSSALAQEFVGVRREHDAHVRNVSIERVVRKAQLLAVLLLDGDARELDIYKGYRILHN